MDWPVALHLPRVERIRLLNAREKRLMPSEFHTPDWVKNAVFYQIFPDRFARSNQVPKPGNLEPWDSRPTVFGFKGGDLMGVVEHLDYLVDLGINAIYFNPIFQSASNHRYHTHDYFRVDPLLGGDEAFRALLEAAHARHIRVVLDGVFNHASRGFFQFNHILETGESSPYIDWFHVRAFPLNAYEGLPNYEAWMQLPALPKFNIGNPTVRRFIFDIARYWLEQGADGWRLDVPGEIRDDGFWQDFRRVVKETNPEAYIVGEIVREARHWLQGDQFDAVMNYQFTQACLGFFGGRRINRQVERGMMGLPATPVLDAPAFARRMEELLQIYPREAAYAQLNLLSSHDMPRFLSMVDGDRATLRLATLFQMTYPGAPCIYYGDEIGMDQGVSGLPEASRYAFLWNQDAWDKELLAFIRRCTALRHKHPALRTGDFISVYARDQIYVYLRRLGEEMVLVAINNGDQNQSLQLPTGEIIPEGIRWVEEMAEESGEISLTRADLVLAPRSGRVFAAL